CLSACLSVSVSSSLCPPLCLSVSFSLSVYVLSLCLSVSLSLCHLCLSAVYLPPCPCVGLPSSRSHSHSLRRVNRSKTAEVCTDENVRELCGYEEVDENLLPENIPDLNVCVCQVASGAWDLCVDFTSSCENIISDRRFLFMSLISLWVGLGLAFIVAVVSMRVVATTYDAAAIAKAEEKKLMKAKFARDSATAAPPFGGPV
ncbi:unnamed protein product, partial [Ectocarpus sp. 13 AM-2016]